MQVRKKWIFIRNELGQKENIFFLTLKKINDTIQNLSHELKNPNPSFPDRDLLQD
jgi:hypothetical protein